MSRRREKPESPSLGLAIKRKRPSRGQQRRQCRGSQGGQPCALELSSESRNRRSGNRGGEAHDVAECLSIEPSGILAVNPRLLGSRRLTCAVAASERLRDSQLEQRGKSRVADRIFNSYMFERGAGRIYILNCGGVPLIPTPVNDLTMLRMSHRRSVGCVDFTMGEPLPEPQPSDRPGSNSTQTVL